MRDALLLPALTLCSACCKIVPSFTALCENLGLHVQNDEYRSLKQVIKVGAVPLLESYTSLLAASGTFMAPLIFLPSEETLRGSPVLSASITVALATTSPRKRGAGPRSPGGNSADPLRGLEILGLSMSDRWCLVSLLVGTLRASGAYDPTEQIPKRTLLALAGILPAASFELYNMLIAQQAPTVVCDCFARSARARGGKSGLLDRMVTYAPAVLGLFLSPPVTAGWATAAPMPLRYTMKAHATESVDYEKCSSLVALRLRVGKVVSEYLSEGSGQLLHGLLYLFTEVCIPPADHQRAGSTNAQHTLASVKSALLQVLVQLTALSHSNFGADIVAYENGAVVFSLLNALQLSHSDPAQDRAADLSAALLIFRNLFAAQALSNTQVVEVLNCATHCCTGSSGVPDPARLANLTAFSLFSDIFHSCMFAAGEHGPNHAETSKRLSGIVRAASTGSMLRAVVDMLTSCLADEGQAAISVQSWIGAREYGLRSAGVLDGVCSFVAALASAVGEPRPENFLNSAAAVHVADLLARLLQRAVKQLLNPFSECVAFH
jgi:hypothetical protein